jgi:hypothetical protein
MFRFGLASSADITTSPTLREAAKALSHAIRMESADQSTAA